ncbi:serine hydrolase domain-containing protein [Thermodesulfobacteriota bacterium B35]
MVQQLDRELKNLCRRGVAEGVFPGVAAGMVLGERGNRQTIVRTAGRTGTDGDNRMTVTEDTLFDLASLTKPLATALIIFALIDEGKLSLHDPLTRFIDPGEGRLAEIDLDMLLTHSSGLAAYRPYYQRFRPVVEPGNSDALVRAILADPLEYEPGSECRYSDLGFILLGRVIEQVSGLGLDECFSRYISGPLDLEEDIFFLRLTGSRHRLAGRSIAATENCPWRGRVLTGEVHDEHCWLMDGVSGHAGLFGTVGAVLTMCTRILDQWQGRGESGAHALATGLQRKYRDRTWCRGFDMPSPQGSSGGHLLSRHSIGHLGYTGTSFWIDPEKKVIMVLLSNRVHPDRSNRKIRRFRPRFHDTLLHTVLDRDGR